VATLYWVGGTGSWGVNSNRFALSSGGTGVITTPTAADDIKIDANSGTGTITVTTGGAVCRSLDFTGYTGTFTQVAASQLTIGDATAGLGNVALKLSSGMTYTIGNSTTSLLVFRSSSATQQTITTAGKSTPTTTFSSLAVGSSYINSDAWTSVGSITLNGGAWDTNNQNITCTVLSFGGPDTRSWTPGSSAISCVSMTISNSSGLTVASNTAVVACGGPISSNNTILALGSYNWNGLSVVLSGTNTAAIVPGSTSATLRNLTIVGGFSKGVTYRFASGITITDTLTVTGNSVVNRVLLFALNRGTPVAISANAVSLQNVDFTDITGAGAAAWAGTSMGDALGNSNITFDAPVDRYIAATGNWSSTASWSTTSGGAGGASVPLPQDRVFVDRSFGSGSLSLDMPRCGTNVNFTGFNRQLSINSLPVTFYGSFTMGAGVPSFSGSQAISLQGRGSHTVDLGGKTMPNSFTFDGGGAGGWTLQSAFTTNSSITVTGSGFYSSGYPVTATTFTRSTAATTTIDISNSLVSLTSSATASIWNIATTAGMTLLASGSVIEFSAVAASNARTFAAGTGNFQYGELRYTVAGSAGPLVITGVASFEKINVSDPSGPKTVRFGSGNTITVADFSVSGAAGRLITIEPTASSAFTLAKSGAGVVSCDYLSIDRSNATPSSTWYAGANSTNVGGSSGWVFTAPPAANQAAFLQFF
jgi:hypothetical protein